MRRLITWNLITLDGFFEGRKAWDLDFHVYVWGDELQQLSIEQLQSADLLVFGRVTYEGMAAYWPPAKGDVAELMNGIGKVVFSRTLERADWQNTRLVSGDSAQEIRRLKSESGKDMFIFGSADLAAALTRQGLIDEYRIIISPVVIGRGTPLFKDDGKPLKLNLIQSRIFRNGNVLLYYHPE